MLSVLANRTYRHLFAAQVIALIGTGMMTVALGLLAFKIAGDKAGAVLGTALAIKMIAYVGVAPMVGGFANFLPRRAFLVSMDFVRAAVALVLPFVDRVWQIPADWVKSAINAHVTLGFREYKTDQNIAGLDVADGGGDRNALALRRAVVLRHLVEWGERDTGTTARRAVDCVAPQPGQRVSVQYDSIGVGSGVKAEINRLTDDGLLPEGVSFASWNAGAAVLQSTPLGKQSSNTWTTRSAAVT